MFNKLLSVFQRKKPAEGGADDRPDVPKKMVFLVRTDVGMQKGKMCAQCGHAVSAALERDNPKIRTWKETGEMKIALKVDEVEMKACLEKAKQMKIPCGKVRDAGHT